jgi:FHS family glucose/mannose:H+ symporter-like MFS transporter
MYRKNLVFAAACMGMLLFGMVFLSLGTISVFIQEKFRVDALKIASLASSLPAGMLIASILFGPVVDRYGYKFILLICSVLIMLALESISFAKSMIALQSSFFLIGFGGGVINGGTNALSADITSEGKGAKLSLLGVFFGVGALGMPLLTGLLSEYYSYEIIISSLGYFILLPVLFFALIRFPEPKQKQGFPLKKALSLVKDPILLLFGCVLFFESALEGMVGNWTTSYLTAINLNNENALYALSCHVAAISLTRLLLSQLLNRISSRIVLFFSFALIFTGAIVLLNVSSFLSSIISMIIIGTGFAAGFPVILGYVGERNEQLSGTAFSLVIVMALTGNTLLNYIVGAVSKSSGISNFPLIIMLCVIFMALIFAIVSHKLSKKRTI